MVHVDDHHILCKHHIFQQNSKFYLDSLKLFYDKINHRFFRSVSRVSIFVCCQLRLELFGINETHVTDFVIPNRRKKSPTNACIVSTKCCIFRNERKKNLLEKKTIWNNMESKVMGNIIF